MTVKPPVSVGQVFELLRRNDFTLSFNEDDVIEWCGELLEEMRIFGSLQEKREVLPVHNGYAVLPCDCEQLKAVILHEGGEIACPEGFVPAETSRGDDYTFIEAGDSLVINGKLYVRAVTARENTDSRPLDNMRYRTTGGFDEGVYLPYEIDCGKLRIKGLNDGAVAIAYTGLAVCSQGFPLIPGTMKQACFQYCYQKLNWVDYKQGKIPKHVWDEIKQETEQAIASGRARYHWPSRNGIERVLARMVSFQRRLPGAYYSHRL